MTDFIGMVVTFDGKLPQWIVPTVGREVTIEVTDEDGRRFELKAICMRSELTPTNLTWEAQVTEANAL